MTVFRRFHDEHRRLLMVLLWVVVANIAFLVVVKPRLARMLATAEQQLDESKEAVTTAQLEYARASLESMLLSNAQAQLDQLRQDILQSVAARYPTVDEKIKAVAASFGLEPQTISYGYEPMPLEKLVRLTVSFRLKGGYGDLRHFVREIEQAMDDEQRDLFFAIEQVTLQDSSDKGKELNLNLSVATYFHDPNLKAGRGRRDTARTRGRQ